jgi:hypothetical protein
LAVFADASVVQVFVAVGRPSVVGVEGSCPVVEVADPKPAAVTSAARHTPTVAPLQAAADALPEMAGIDVDLVELAGDPAHLAAGGGTGRS